MRVLVDTGVFISAIDRNDVNRTKKAKDLFAFLKANNATILYSKRTQIELERCPSNERREFLKQFELANYHFGNESWEKVWSTWENISSSFGDEIEFDISEKLNKWLIKLKDLADRGIILDAIYNKCDYLFHENPRDFSKIPESFFRDFNLKAEDLLRNSSIESYFG